MPALSPTMLCSHMLAGASAASSMIGSVVEDVETVADVSSSAALALEMTTPPRAVCSPMKCGACGRVCMRQYTFCMRLMHVVVSKTYGQGPTTLKERVWRLLWPS